MKSSASSWSSLRLLRGPLLAVACFLPVVACSGVLDEVLEQGSISELPDGSPTFDGASGRARPDASRGEVPSEDAKDASAVEVATDAAGDATVADAAGDATVADAAGDATVADAAGDATVADVVLGSGNVPPIQFARRTLKEKAGKTNREKLARECPTATTYYIDISHQSATVKGCCIERKPPEYTVNPVVLTVRLVAGVENVCLEGAVGGNTGTVCAPVDAGGLATFAQRFSPGQASIPASAELRRLYAYWGFSYGVGSTSALRIQLSTSRDLATMTFELDGTRASPAFNSWEDMCGTHVGTRVQPTTVDIPLL